MKEHPYIKLIEYAMENRRFTINQACIAACISREEFMFVRDDLFILNGNQIDPIIPEHQEMEWKLSPNALFGYIQYQAHQDALESARKADKRAIWAMGISAISAIAAFSGSLVEIF